MSEAVEARGHLRTRARLATWLSLPAVRARLAVGALAAGAVVFLLPAPGVGWNQGAHYALVRALADGTPRIDRTQHEVGGGGTGDVSVIHGHYYAAKSPGLAFEALTPYLAMKAAGRADPVRDATGQVWFLTIWGAVLPALILLVLVRFVAERLEPGFGAAAALTLGLTTMILPFATMFFSHALSATLVFAAFTVLWWERRAPPRLALVFCAGLLAGLAATTEFPVAVIGAILGLYAVARAGVARRLLAYAAGACIGGLPTLLFNLWAFGSAFEFPYANVIQSGTNKTGLFGITTPKFDVLVRAPVRADRTADSDPCRPLGGDRSRLPLQTRAPRRGARGGDDRDRLPADQLRLRVAVRRQFAGAALPRRRAAVPCCRVRRGLQEVPADDRSACLVAGRAHGSTRRRRLDLRRSAGAAPAREVRAFLDSARACRSRHPRRRACAFAGAPGASCARARALVVGGSAARCRLPSTGRSRPACPAGGSSKAV
jgi:hypothetical protein